MGGNAVKNLHMFKKLCGEEAFKRVVIVTNRWGEVKAGVGEKREAELKRQRNFYEFMITRGAQMARHVDPTRMDGRQVEEAQSAEDIIRLLVDRTDSPVALRIQKELVDERKNITETAAAGELDRGLRELTEKHQQEMRELKQAMDQAAKDRDEENMKMLETMTKGIEEAIQKIGNDRRNLGLDYEEDKMLMRAYIREQVKQTMAAPAPPEIYVPTNLLSNSNTAASGSHVSNNDDGITIPIFYG